MNIEPDEKMERLKKICDEVFLRSSLELSNNNSDIISFTTSMMVLSLMFMTHSILACADVIGCDEDLLIQQMIRDVPSSVKEMRRLNKREREVKIEA